MGEKGRVAQNLSSPDPVLRGPCSKKHILKFLADLKQLPAPPCEHQQNDTKNTFSGTQPKVPCLVCLRSPPAVQQRIKKGRPFTPRLLVSPGTCSE